MNLRLDPSQSIRKRQEFRVIHKSGRFVRGKLFNVWAYRGSEVLIKDSAKPRIGIIVSRKVSLRANKRNLWKRRIREAFRLHQHDVMKGTALLVQAKKQEEIPSYQEVASQLQKALVKAKVWKKPRKG